MTKPKPIIFELNAAGVLEGFLDLSRRMGALEDQLQYLNGSVAGLLGQQRESLERQSKSDALLNELAVENRQWRRHVERLMRQKEALLEALGRHTLEQQTANGPLIEPSEDLLRAMRELDQMPVHRNSGN